MVYEGNSADVMMADTSGSVGFSGLWLEVNAGMKSQS